MKILYTIIFFLILPYTSYSELNLNKVIIDFEVMQKSGNAGREFWISNIPIHQKFSKPDSVKIYILSSVKTNVEISIERKNFVRLYEIEPNKLKLITLDTSFINPLRADSTKLKDADIYKESAVHVKSDFPMVMYVFNKNHSHSDGYFAIPTTASGNKYKNSAYYSSDYGNVLYPAYTSIISQYDSTNVKITMGGGALKDDEIEFEDGRLIKSGESTTQSMNKGDILLLSGNDNLHDISGSLIESDKPITILSGNPGVQIPVEDGVSDFAINMEFPTYLYGQQFVFTPLKYRDSPGLFRAFALEDDTKVYRNDEFVGTILSGDGADYGESYIEFDSWFKMSDVEIVSITSDKPILLVYYNRYEPDKSPYFYDNNAHFIQIPSIEQMTKSSMFSAPYHYSEGTTTFKLNHLVITFPLNGNEIPDDIYLAEYDSLGVNTNNLRLIDEHNDKLNIIYINKNGKNYGSVTIELEYNKVYSLSSSYSIFSTYNYGSALNTAYGIPTGFSLYERHKKDSLPPVVYYEQDCDGNINLNTATVTDMPMNEENRSNIADAYMMAGENYEFKWETESGEFIPGRNQNIRWSLEKINKNQPASALLYFVDKAGNDTTILIESDPKAELEMLTTVNEIRNPNFKTISFQDTIRNLSNYQSLYLTRLEIANTESKFKIDSFDPNGWTPGTPIPPNQERYINYTFTDDNIEDNMTYSDSVYIGFGVNNGDQITECEFKPFSEVSVSTLYPQLFATQKHNFGTFDDDSKSIKLQDTIRNLSTNTDLYLSRIELKEKDKGFSIGSISPFDWNIDKPIKPESEVIVDIIFNPKAYPQTEDEQILVDSLGIGIQEYDINNELEEVSFSYRTEHKAIIKAKDPESSVASDKVLAQYMNITESSVELLPKVLLDGFYDLSIYTLEGAKLISISTDKQNTISLSKLTSGTYIVTLKSKTKLLSKKISVVR